MIGVVLTVVGWVAMIVVFGGAVAIGYRWGYEDGLGAGAEDFEADLDEYEQAHP